MFAFQNSQYLVYISLQILVESLLCILTLSSDVNDQLTT